MEGDVLSDNHGVLQVNCYGDLSTEDYQRLPETAKPYEGSAENEIIRVTPSVLKFPHDDPSQHLAKLVIWNKTKKKVDFRIQPPQSKHFSFYCEKFGIYAGSEETVLVKVRPFDEKLVCSILKIQLVNGVDLTIPLELLPNSSWFILPKLIIMPIVPVGKSFEVLLPMPKPPEDEKEMYFFVSIGNSEAITVTPPDGHLRHGQGTGTELLVLTYHPREYTTLSHTILLHFPCIQKKPYGITLYLRSYPTTYGRTEVCIFPPIKKLLLKPTKLKPLEGKVNKEEMKAMEDLLTPGAVAKFLLRPAGKTSSAMDLSSPSGQTQYEDHRRYKEEETKFYASISQFQSVQHNLNLQPSRSYLGSDPIEEDSEIYKEIVAERDKQRFLYEKWMGLDKNNIDDLTREKVKLSRQRGLRDLDKTLFPQTTKPRSTSTTQVKGHILRPFIQSALTLIVRFRGTKRIIKLRILIREYKTLNILNKKNEFNQIKED